jgi:hypothetical protein
MTTANTIGYLLIDHVRGREIHPLTKASWNLYRGSAADADTLHFYVEARGGVWNSNDYAQMMTPWWEICVVEPSISPTTIVAGAKFDVPFGHSEARGGHVTNLYFYEHESTVQNSIRVLETDGARRLVRMVGLLGSKSQFWADNRPEQEAAISVVAWFEHDPASYRNTQ